MPTHRVWENSTVVLSVIHYFLAVFAVASVIAFVGLGIALGLGQFNADRSLDDKLTNWFTPNLT